MRECIGLYWPWTNFGAVPAAGAIKGIICMLLVRATWTPTAYIRRRSYAGYWINWSAAFYISAQLLAFLYVHSNSLRRFPGIDLCVWVSNFSEYKFTTLVSRMLLQLPFSKRALIYWYFQLPYIDCCVRLRFFREIPGNFPRGNGFKIEHKTDKKKNKQRLLTLSQLESGCAHCARVSPWLLNKYTVLEGRLIEFFVALPSSSQKEHIERLATQNFYVKEPARSSIDSRSRGGGGGHCCSIL